MKLISYVRVHEFLYDLMGEEKFREGAHEVIEIFIEVMRKREE